MDILIFGDSGAYGAWDIKGGWVQRLREVLDKENVKDLENFTLTYNLSISGDTTEDILKRFDTETKAYLRGRKARMIIFSVGVNDSRLINGKPAVISEQFRKNISDLINEAKKHTARIVFIGLEVIYPKFVRWSKTETYNIEDVKEYNNVIKEVCKENKVYFIEIFDKIIKMNYKDLLQDELHYNSEGHKKLFKIIKDFLMKNKLIKI